MSLFGLFGDDESKQRRSQIMAYFQQQQAQQQAQIQAQQAKIDADIAANRALPTPEQQSVQANNAYREGLVRDLDTTYGPNYSYQTFADTADDPIIDAILSKQRGTAQNAIDMAKQRGQLNTSGYNAALAGLNDAGTAARSDANALGGGVLSRYRQNLDDAIASLRSSAAGASPGFDLEGAKTGIANRVADANKNLAGDIQSAIGSKNYFDTGKILGTAGTQQGFVNPGTAPVTDTATTDELKRRRANVNQVF